MAADTLTGRAIAFLVAPLGTEQMELTHSWQAVREAGGEASLISTETGRIQAFDHLDPADSFNVDATVGQVTAADFDGLVLPGGVANPDFLRTDPMAVGFVADFFSASKPVAAICHAPWVLIEAGAVRGRILTSFPSLRTDLINAGAEWVDESVVVDRGLVTSRKPADLTAFCEAFLTEFSSG